MLRLAVHMLAVMLCAVPLWARSWESLSGLKPGDRIRVRDTSGQEHRGAFIAMSVDALTLAENKREISIERARIRRVRVRSNLKRVRNVLIGAGIGLVIGILVDKTWGTLMRNEGGQSSSTRAVSYILPIAVFGGIFAALPTYSTVYRAP